MTGSGGTGLDEQLARGARRICMFNPPWFVGNIVFPVVKAFMSPKLKSRLAVCKGSNPANLTEFFPLTSLTEEHAGSFSFDLASWAPGIAPAV